MIYLTVWVIIDFLIYFLKYVIFNKWSMNKNSENVGCYIFLLLIRVTFSLI